MEKINSAGHQNKRMDLWLRKRLADMAEQAGMGYKALAVATGQPYSRIKRLIGGEASIIDATLACSIAVACGRSPHELFDATLRWSPGRTGIRSVDAMVVAVYNHCSPTGLEAMADYVSNEYRVMCSGYDDGVNELERRLVDVEPLLANGSTNNRKGMTFADEYAHNERAARDTQTEKCYQLMDLDWIDDIVWVQYTLEERTAATADRLVTRQLVDLLALEHPLDRYRSNGRLKPKITKRLWKQLATSRENNNAFVTDWAGYGRDL